MSLWSLVSKEGFISIGASLFISLPRIRWLNIQFTRWFIALDNQIPYRMVSIQSSSKIHRTNQSWELKPTFNLSTHVCEEGSQRCSTGNCVKSFKCWRPGVQLYHIIMVKMKSKQRCEQPITGTTDEQTQELPSNWREGFACARLELRQSTWRLWGKLTSWWIADKYPQTKTWKRPRSWKISWMLSSL